MMELLNQAKIGISFLKLVQDPHRTEEIFKITDLAKRSKDQSGIQAILARAMQSPEFAEQCRTRYRPPVTPIAELSRFPEGTLGRAYADHMNRYQFVPDFFPSIEVECDADYLKLRMREMHDIWHVVTGFDASVRGELGLQGVAMSQLNDGMSGLLISAGLIHTLKTEPQSIVHIMDAIVAGYQLGKRAKPLVGMKWEENWGASLADLRAQFDVVVAYP